MATLTDSLSNGLKSLFSGLGAKTSNTTNGGVPLLNTSTGEPNGMMTAAIFAKLMGANMNGKMGMLTDTSSGSMNDLTDGFYYTGSLGNLTNAPSYGTTSDQSIIMCFGQNTPRRVQVVFSQNNSTNVARIAIRAYTYQGWADWKTVTLT